MGSKQKRDVKRLWPLVEQTNEVFRGYVESAGLTARLPQENTRWPELTAAEKARVDAVAKPKAAELIERAREKGESLDDLLPEAFALVKFACWRMVGERWMAGGNEITWDMVPFDVQLMGGAALHQGNISEMATGEGKTLVAILPLYLNALTGRGAHLVTVNDYLSKRDSEWMGPIYEYLGLTVGCIDKSEPHTAERRAAYRCDITYGTNNEFGFDYLRDNMVLSAGQLVQRDLNYAIVDEVDSILIDEARTPLIISGPVHRSTQQYDRLVPYVRELVSKQIHLVNRLAGEAEERLAQDENDYDAGIRLVQCMKGAPKHRRYMRLRNVPSNQRLQERVEHDFMRDKRVPELEGELFFVVDERGFSVALTDKGRAALSPEDPNYWALPDIVEETSEIEGVTEITAEDRRRLLALELLPDAEVKRRKIKACPDLSPQEALELIRAVSCPGLPEAEREQAIERVRSGARKRMEEALREIAGVLAVAPAERKALQDLAHWKRRAEAIERLRHAAGLEEARRDSLLARLLDPVEGLARGEALEEAEAALAGAAPGDAGAPPRILETELAERKIRKADLPDEAKLEVIRVLRDSSLSAEARAEAVERLKERFRKRIAYQKEQVEKAVAPPPPPPEPVEGEAPPEPPPPPEEVLEAQIKTCGPLTPAEREEMLKRLRRGREEFERRLEALAEVAAQAQERLEGLIPRFLEALTLDPAEREALARANAPAPLDEELVIPRILASELFRPEEREDLIEALWAPALLPEERRTRVQRAQEMARARAEERYRSVVESAVLCDNDREIFAARQPELLDEELLHRKILLSPLLRPEEKRELLAIHWAPHTPAEKRAAQRERRLGLIRERLARESGAEAAAALDSLFTLTDSDRAELPALREPLPDSTLRERKIKRCPALSEEDRLALFRAVHCPGMDDEVRQVFIRRALEAALARAGDDPQARAEIEECLTLTDEDRRALPATTVELYDDELRERKILQCRFLAEAEAAAMLKALWAPDVEDERRHAVIAHAKETAKARRRELHDKKAEELHNISQLLVAYMLKEKDVDYVLEDNKIIIVDEHTGRKMPGRRWSDGLHQAVEAKEGVRIEAETQTLATVTIQNFFRMYEKLAGMTGTAETEAGEFAHTYGMDVIVVPTNRPITRVDLDDVIYQTKREKYAAVIEEIRRLHNLGLPVLVGTISVEVSETLSRMLRRAGISHNVLNAKNHAREAEIVRDAGKPGAVTIATNMAGRGTDIKLGQGVRESRRYTDENGAEQEWPGGLQIVGTERHDARRIDRQLRGRSGRQGDPGTSRFFVSLEDDLMRLFGSDRLAKVMSRLGMREGEPIIHPWVSKAITRAQKKVEEINFERRKRTLEYDNVMNKQREAIYGLRRELLTAESPRETLLSIMAEGIAAEFARKYGDPASKHSGDWDLEGWLGWLQRICLYADFRPLGETAWDSFEDLLEAAMQRVAEGFDHKRESLGEGLADSFSRYVTLRTLDELWQDHLLAMDDLREGIHLRSYAQRDPLVEYTHDATELFNEMMAELQRLAFERYFRLEVVASSRESDRIGKIQYRKEEAAPATVAQGGGPAGAAAPEGPKYHTVRRDQPKVGPNDPCPCGSGKKYKKCCGSAKVRQQARAEASAEARAAAATDDLES